MTKTDYIQRFGRAANVAHVLGISKQAVHLWPEKVPALRRRELDELLADPAVQQLLADRDLVQQGPEFRRAFDQLRRQAA